MTGSGATGILFREDGTVEGWVACDRAGVDCFGNVSHVEFDRYSTFTDATFAQVGRLTELQELDLQDSSASDADLSRLVA